MEQATVVLGERLYAVERPWGRLPEGKVLGRITQLAVDSAGRVYVFQRAEPPVTVFDAEGAWCGGWGADEILDSHGIAIAPDDRVFLVDRDAHQIRIYSTAGALLGTLGERHSPRHGAPFNHPTDVAVAADGEIYVADGYGNSHIHRFAADGTWLQTWGGPGDGPGAFSTPHGIWVDRQDRVLVADRENDRVQLFSRDGGWLGEWRDLSRPMDIYEDNRGMILVTDCVPRLSMFAPDGSLAGRCRPTWNSAHGVWGSANGDIFLAETTPNRITRLRPLERPVSGV